MVMVALLSNPRSTGNRAILPRVREFCASNPDIFHYEVEEANQIGQAFRTIALVKPRVIVINGGDGTVQSALTELYSGGHFGGNPPPVAVLPNGKTNLIALDLGSEGDPLEALERIIQIAKTDLDAHVIQRELIALSSGEGDNRPVLGMFLGGAGLAEVILYCREKIYPLGLPNSVSHMIAAMAAIVSILFRIGGRLLPAKPEPVSVSLTRDGQIQGRFSLLIVTTLEKMLFNFKPSDSGGAQDALGRMKLVAVDQDLSALVKVGIAGALGKFGRREMSGVHFQSGDIIRIEGARSNVVLDGEVFEASHDRPIILKSTPPVPFLSLAA